MKSSQRKAMWAKWKNAQVMGISGTAKYVVVNPTDRTILTGIRGQSRSEACRILRESEKEYSPRQKRKYKSWSEQLDKGTPEEQAEAYKMFERRGIY